ncbi:hypothetical protein Pfo_011090 [Paulownia fortunei]|nr:hypothetical protein Pfo_011090 [Paulownia fortunei]
MGFHDTEMNKMLLKKNNGKYQACGYGSRRRRSSSKTSYYIVSINARTVRTCYGTPFWFLVCWIFCLCGIVLVELFIYN